MLVIKAKIRISDFTRASFLENKAQPPITANIIKTESRVKDNVISVVICSATESVKESVLVKKGLIAFKNLNVGKATKPEENIPIPERIIEKRSIEQLRNFEDSLLNFLINSAITT